MIELWQQINQLSDDLFAELSEMHQLGCQYAEADANYREAKAKAILQERAAGTPSTLAKDVIYAREEIKAALLSRDCAQSMYEVSKERVMAIKLSLRLIEAQYDREWAEVQRRDQYVYQ